ncbi:LemA family protein [Rhodoblastus acidophilus]|nr:LemA family protein [Rhodoblastus acidophilus]MCW2318391.1 LemA protein [Rhodoblastus acidophilus]
MIWHAFNRLGALDSRCDRAFADIDVQLKHRHNLLPNLLETVRAFANQELEILGKVTAARGAALGAQTPEQVMAAEADLSVGLARLMAVVESYPQLQSSAHFQQLRMEISDAENKIAASRRFFNASVDEYNATLRQFPANFVANLARHHRRRTFFDIGVERVLLDEAPVLKF